MAYTISYASHTSACLFVCVMQIVAIYIQVTNGVAITAWCHDTVSTIVYHCFISHEVYMQLHETECMQYRVVIVRKKEK